MRGLSAIMLVSSVQWTYSASCSFCGSAGHYLSRSTWQHIWRPRTAISASASVTKPLSMTSTSCPSPSMTGIQVRLYSTRLPRRWRISTQAGAGGLFDLLRMAIRRWQGVTRAWSCGYSAYWNLSSCECGTSPTSCTCVFSRSTWPLPGVQLYGADVCFLTQGRLLFLPKYYF